MPLSRSFDEFVASLAEIVKEDHDRETLVVDSADWLERLIWDRVAEDAGKQSIEDIGFARGYKLALTYWERVFAGLADARDQRGMAIICHCPCAGRDILCPGGRELR